MSLRRYPVWSRELEINCFSKLKLLQTSILSFKYKLDNLFIISLHHYYFSARFFHELTFKYFGEIGLYTQKTDLNKLTEKMLLNKRFFSILFRLFRKFCLATFINRKK